MDSFAYWQMLVGMSKPASLGGLELRDWHVLARVVSVCVGPTGPRLPTGPPSRSSLCRQIRGTDKSSARELHIAYRYGEHYDSVRRINDNSEAPAHLLTDVSEAQFLLLSGLQETGTKLCP